MYFTTFVPCGKYRKVLIMSNYEGQFISDFAIVIMQTSKIPHKKAFAPFYTCRFIPESLKANKGIFKNVTRAS